MANNRVGKIREKMKNSFLIAQPFVWNSTQKEIIDKMLNRNTSCVIIDALAGCGKTIMSTYAALTLLQEGKYKKIYYVRSAVESAGTKIGSLPGDISEKCSEYGQPLIDSLHKLLNPLEIAQFLDSKTIEVVPLSFLRGRSLKDAIIIGDECQNWVLFESILVMTRLEESSKLFLIADSDQCDLPKNQQREFEKLVNLFNDPDSRNNGISYYEMKDPDLVMRSKFVKFVSKRYSDYKKLINT
jgi:phosphate starvation-inducible PhoH-like protein